MHKLTKHPSIIVTPEQQRRRKAKKVEHVNQPLRCFKAYDVRGRVPEELNEDIAYRIGCAYAVHVRPAEVVVGFEVSCTFIFVCLARLQDCKRLLTKKGLISQDHALKDNSI